MSQAVRPHLVHLVRRIPTAALVVPLALAGVLGTTVPAAAQSVDAMRGIHVARLLYR